MTITIHLVRHAQGFHNLNHVNEAIPDPYLTPLGHAQCDALRSSFPSHGTITHLVASPMRRTLLTCYHSFQPSVLGSSSSSSSSPAPGKKIIALPLVQEVSANPCDTGSEPVMLRAEFGDLREDGGARWLDDRVLERGWNDKTSEGSRWAPTPERLEERAGGARRWLRDLGRKSGDGEDAEIVVVTHGGFLHFLTQDWDGMDLARGTGWANTEWRSYTFVDPQGDDAEARIRETDVSWRRRRGSATPLTETDQKQARAVVVESMRKAWLETNSNL